MRFLQSSKLFIYFLALIAAFIVWLFLKPHFTSAISDAPKQLEPAHIHQSLTRELQASKEQERHMLQEKQESEQQLQYLQARWHELMVAIYSRNFNQLFYLSYYCREIAQLQELWQANQAQFERTRERVEMELMRLTRLQNALKSSGSQLTHTTLYQDCFAQCQTLKQGYEQHEKQLQQSEKQLKQLGTNIRELNDFANGYIGNNKEKGQLSERIAQDVLSPNSIYNEYFTGNYSISNLAKELVHHAQDKLINPIDTQFGKASRSLALILGLSAALLLMAARISKKRLRSKRARAFLTPLRWLSLLLISSICAAFLPQGFINLNTKIINEFILLTSLLYAALSISFYSVRVERGLALFSPLVLANTLCVSMSVLMLSGVFLELTSPFIFFMAALSMGIRLRAGFAKLRIRLRLTALSSIALLLACGIGSLMGYCYLMMILSLFWFVFIINCLLIANLKKLARYTFPALLRTRIFSQYGIYPAIWLKLIINYLVAPTIFLIMLWYGLLWPAECFNLGHFLSRWMEHDFNFESIIRVISANRILTIISLGIIIHALIKIVQFTMEELYRERKHSGRMQTIMTLAHMVIWAVFTIFSLHLLHADYKSILVIMGGMSVGIGIALKDTLDNLVSGLSLIFGRLRVGDIVECNNIRGRIKSIGYRTTTLETMEGSVLCFQNSQLFNQDFRNLTRNHEYERNEFVVGIEYGEDVKKARALILDALSVMRMLSPKEQTRVLLYEFGDSTVNLLVRIWVPAKARTRTLSIARELIYESFNKNGVTFPFPQRDIHIIPADPSENLILKEEQNPQQRG